MSATETTSQLRTHAIAALGADAVKTRRLNVWLSWGVPLAFAVLLVLLIPLKRTIEFSADEGYTAAKALLVNRGHQLYTEVWCDQPPLYTVLVARALKLDGGSIYPARLMSVAFSCVLLWAVLRIIGHLHGPVAGLAAAILLESSPQFMEQSVSVMSELPALAVAFVGLFTLTAYFRSRGPAWLVLSGLLFGVALQLKGMSALVFGALFSLSVICRRSTPHSPFLLCVWITALLLAFTTIRHFYGAPGVASLLSFHLNHRIQQAFQAEHIYVFAPSVLWSDLPLLVLALSGITIGILKKQPFILLPISICGLSVLVHSVIQPFWPWYYLHFSIPLAWLSGIAISTAVSFLKPPPGSSNCIRRFLPPAMAAALIAVLALNTLSAFVTAAASLQARPQIQNSSIIATMVHFKRQIKFAYADRVIYPFHAGIEVLPWSAVMSKKRIIADGLTTATIIRRIILDHPELLLVNKERYENSAFRALVDRLYVRLCSEDGLCLFLAKECQS